MQENIPKYKLCTAKPVNRTVALDHFTNFLSTKILYKDKEAYLCVDDSLLVFHSSGIENLVFLEIHCSVIAISGKGEVTFGAIANFIGFCAKHKTNIKILRHKKYIVPPSGGAIISDLFHSLAWKKANHYACLGYRCPKDNRIDE
jgi:hypothetical protein